MSQVIELSKSDLAGARDTGRRDFLESSFKKAADVIKAGGTVHLMQVYSDAHKEISEVIENMEQLEHWQNLYMR